MCHLVTHSQHFLNLEDDSYVCQHKLRATLSCHFCGHCTCFIPPHVGNKTRTGCKLLQISPTADLAATCAKMKTTNPWKSPCVCFNF